MEIPARVLLICKNTKTAQFAFNRFTRNHQKEHPLRNEQKRWWSSVSLISVAAPSNSLPHQEKVKERLLLRLWITLEALHGLHEISLPAAAINTSSPRHQSRPTMVTQKRWWWWWWCHNLIPPPLRQSEAHYVLGSRGFLNPRSLLVSVSAAAANKHSQSVTRIVASN